MSELSWISRGISSFSVLFSCNQMQILHSLALIISALSIVSAFRMKKVIGLVGASSVCARRFSVWTNVPLAPPDKILGSFSLVLYISH